MKKNKMFSIFGGIATFTMLAVMASCAQNEPDGKTGNEPGTSTTSIETLIRNYHDYVNSSTRSLEMPIKIKSVTSKRHSLTATKKQALITRGSNENDTLPYEIKTVEFNLGETDGYAVLSDDPRINRVFYYSEEGSPKDTAYITPLKALFDSYPSTADRLIGPALDPDEPYYHGTLIVRPLVKYKWGQGYPFNLACIYCTCPTCTEKGNHMPAGCANIAMAQTIATLGYFHGTLYGSDGLDFKSLPAKSDDFTENQKLNVSRFILEIALNCQTQFRCDGSSTTMEADVNYLRDLGYTCEMVSGALNVERTITLLKRGFPHLMRGTSYRGGHMWIIDGVGSQNGQYDFHCNWGWDGSSNGWSIGDPFTVCDTFEQFNEAHKHIYITSKPNN